MKYVMEYSRNMFLCNLCASCTRVLYQNICSCAISVSVVLQFDDEMAKKHSSFTYENGGS